VLHGDPTEIWKEVPVKSFFDLSVSERSRLARQQKLVMVWSVLASFSYALIWYWLPATDSFIQAQYGFSPFQVGILISTFGGAFIVTNFMWGHLNDVYWPYRVVTVGLIVAGASTFIYPLLTGFTQMILIRVIEGVFNGAAWSGLVKTIQLWFPIEKRSRNLGIMIAVYSWAISVDLAVGGIVSASYGWEYWARVVGIVGIVVGAFTFFAAKPYGPLVGLPHIDWGDVAPTKKTSFLARSSALFRYRWMILAILSGVVVIGGANVISGFWFSDLITMQSLPPSQLELLATSWGVAQGILILIFGPLSDRMKRRVIFVKIGMLGGFLSFLGIVLLTVIHNVNIAIVWFVTISTGIPFLIAGPIFALLADRYGVQLVGMASGYFEGFGTGGGAFLFPLIVGGLASVSGSTTAWGVLAAIVFVIAIAWMFQREYTVGRSLVDASTLKVEKEMKEKEFEMS